MDAATQLLDAPPPETSHCPRSPSIPPKLTLLVLALLAGCTPAASTPFDPGGDPRLLPRLPDGAHIGLWPSYEALPIGTAVRADLALQAARDAGMAVGRIHVSWADLEPSPGRFELDSLGEALANASLHGYATLVLLETIDSEGFVLPADLVHPDDPYRLAGDLRFGDPRILDRFGALLHAISPLLIEHRVFALSVGNEPDNRFDDFAFDSAEGLAWSEDLSAFLSAARSQVHQDAPGLAVGMTLRQSSLERGIDLAPILEAGDLALFNYYCQDAALQVKDAASVGVDLGALIIAAEDRPVVLQELGCPAGFSDSALGASEAAQAAFFAALGDEMQARSELRAAFVFQLVDWSPGLSAEIGEAIADEGYPEFAAQVEESLATLGLLRYDDGGARPALATVYDAIAALR